MHAHNRTDIAGQIAAAGGDGKVLDRVQAIGVDHKIAVVLVYRRSLAPVPVVEELWQRLPLDVVDGVHVEPGAVAGEHNGMGLGDEVFPSSILNKLLSLSLSSSVALGLRALVLGRVAHLLIFKRRRLCWRAFRGIEGVV